jgi:hypothetical protein
MWLWLPLLLCLRCLYGLLLLLKLPELLKLLKLLELLMCLVRLWLGRQRQRRLLLRLRLRRRRLLHVMVRHMLLALALELLELLELLERPRACQGRLECTLTQTGPAAARRCSPHRRSGDLSRRFHPQFRDKNRRDIGKSQSK